MSANKLIADLIQLGVELGTEGEDLAIRGPKGVFTSDLRTRLQKHKPTLLGLLGNENGRSALTLCRPAYNQQAMWFQHQIAPHSTAYNVNFAARICSAVDVPALKNACQCLLDRHPTLRTTYAMYANQLVQQIHQHMDIAFYETNAAKWSEKELASHVTAAHQHPFDLHQGPIFRVELFTLGPQNHILLLTTHHIAADAWSLWIILDELRTLYPAQQAGIAAKLPPLASQYTDYSHWQATILSGENGKEQEAYWRQQLAGKLPVLNLPTDRPRPAIQTHQGASLPFTLDQDVVQALKTIAQERRTTLFTVLLAAFQTLLHRYTGQNKILVGSPTIGRSQAKFLNVVGDFINMIVLSADCHSQTPFSALLAQVRQNVLEGLTHQDYPFPRLVEQLQPMRDASYAPIFQAAFVMQKPQRFAELTTLFISNQDHQAPVDLGGLQLEPYPVAQQEGQVDLSLEIAETDAFLAGGLKYNTDLFDAATIKRMIIHFQTLLRGIAADPEQRLIDLPLLSDAEYDQLIHAWNDTHVNDLDTTCTHQLFAQQAKKTPQAVALQATGEAWHYETLEQHANQLANYLQELGVGPEVTVALCMERSARMMVALLGILKAGGAYIPLDPSYPQERLAHMLADAQPALLLTESELLSKLPDQGIQTLCLDSDWEVISREPITQPVQMSTPDNLAYIIYTSGSTGKPKGVQITHRSMGNFLQAMRLQPGFTADDVLFAVTTLSFDIAVLELFLPLIVGGKVVLAGRKIVTDGVRLGQELDRVGATVMQATPATWQLLTRSGWQGVGGLKVLCGGEALPMALARQLQTYSNSLWNMYGPTETTVWSAVCRVAQVKDELTSVPIGKPIANTEIYILDQQLRPVPVGIPGEVYIGGNGLARGYWNRQKLTAAKFIPDPFSREPGARLYRVGDVARYLLDGNIQFLGRTDHQVKIRGFRIELGEIEVALRQHTAVSEAVVVAKTNRQTGLHYLVAYIVAAAQATLPPVNEIRRFLERRLPAYMVPSKLIQLTALPFTPNGKVNRQALPDDKENNLQVSAVYIAPQTKLERQVAAIWQDVLQVHKVGIEDNFFDLGGHSLLIPAMHQRLQSLTTKEVAVVDLFTYPTIRALAHYLQLSEKENGASLLADKQRLQKGQNRLQAQRLKRQNKVAEELRNL